mmetsp:Transcript_6356/g.9689  ORF Transcript_6356/g.9689 Transcript_6356/m.9689 type:complete len:179 (-) Transcript_6356:1594-2130(-)
MAFPLHRFNDFLIAFKEVPYIDATITIQAYHMNHGKTKESHSSLFSQFNRYIWKKGRNMRRRTSNAPWATNYESDNTTIVLKKRPGKGPAPGSIAPRRYPGSRKRIETKSLPTLCPGQEGKKDAVPKWIDHPSSPRKNRRQSKNLSKSNNDHHDTSLTANLENQTSGNQTGIQVVGTE